MFPVQLVKSIRFSGTVRLALENAPGHPLDLLPGEHLWEKILGYLSDFRDWTRCASACRLFQKVIHREHWAEVKDLHVKVLDWNYDDDELDTKVAVKIKLKVDASKKGKGKAAVSREEPFSARPLVVQSKAWLSADKSLLATELIAKRAVNLEAVSFKGSFLPERTAWDTSELCHRFVCNCTTRSLRSVKRLNIALSSCD